MISVSTQIAREDDLTVFARMLDSISFADHITIYAMDRNDADFKKLGSKYKAKIVSIKTPQVVEIIRARQVREAKGEWVLVMDYDEVITPALAREIVSVTQKNSHASAYMIARRNYSLGFPVRYGGFGDDYVHRLFYVPAFIDWPSHIHSTPQVRGRVGQLQERMEHHKDASLAQMVAKTNRYSDIEAQQFLDGGLPPVTPVTLIRKPVMEFLRRYIMKKGFFDGRIGLIQALYQSYSVFITYAKLYEKQRRNST